ncbi:MAG: hypothetical protein WC880_04165 [Candidatus Paceibacterota bacterium]
MGDSTGAERGWRPGDLSDAEKAWRQSPAGQRDYVFRFGSREDQERYERQEALRKNGQ